MAENKTIKTTLDFDVLNADKLDSIFSSIRENLSSEKLKSEVDRINHMTGTMFAKMRHELESSGKITLKGSGIDRVTRQYASLVDKVFKELSGASLEEEFKQIDNSLAQRHASISKAYMKIQEVEKQMDQKRAKLAERGDDTDIFGIKAGHLDTADKISAKLEELTKKKKELEDSKKSTTGIEKQIEGLDKYAEEFKKLQAELGRMRQQIGGHRGSAGRSQIAIEQLEASKIEIQKKIAEGAGEGQEGYKEFVALLEMIQNEYRAIARAQQEAFDQKGAEEIKKEEEALKKLNKQQKESKKSWGAKILQGFSYYAIFNRIKKLWTTSIRTLQELDRAMVQAAIVTNMTQKETWKLLGSYQELAKEVGRSTSEIAGLSAFFLQQGMSVKNAAEMTEVAAKSAAIAGISLQEAANYLTSAVNGFGLAASAAEDVADKFAAVGAASAANFEELAIAMSKVAPVAQSAGVGLDFMLGVLAKGIHTTREAPENIGTAFKTIFARMRELTDIGKATEDGMSLNRVEKALQSVGVALRDEIGQFRNLEDVLYDVGHQWKNLDSLQQAYLATALAGSRQQPRLMAILNDFETTVDFIEISKDSAKAMEYQHMEYMDGMEAASQAVKNAWEGVITTIVSSDAIVSVLKATTKALEGLTKIIGFFTKGGGKFIGVLVLMVTSTAALSIGLKAAGAAAVKFAGMIGLTIPAVKAASVEVTRLGITMSAAMWKVTAIAAVIVGLVAAFSWLSKSADKASESIARSNKLIYESQSRQSGLEKTIKEYEELEKKAHKTNEELERMIELRDELSRFDGKDGTLNFIQANPDGTASIDYKEVAKAIAAERAARAKSNADIQKEINKTNSSLSTDVENVLRAEKNINLTIQEMQNDYHSLIGQYEDTQLDEYLSAARRKQEEIIRQQKYLEDIMEESQEKISSIIQERFEEVSEGFFSIGISSGKNFLEGIESETERAKIESALERAMKSVSGEAFVVDNRFDMARAHQIGKELAEAIMKGAVTEDIKRERYNYSIQQNLEAQLSSYREIIKEVNKIEGLTEESKREIEFGLNFHFSNEVALDRFTTLFEEDEIALEIVAEFIDKEGKLEDLQTLLKHVGQMGGGASDKETIKQQQEERNRLQDEIDALEQDSLAKEQAAQEKIGKKWGIGKKKRQDKIADQLAKDLAENEEAKQDLQSQLNSMMTDEELALKNALSPDELKSLFDHNDIGSGIEAMKKALMNEAGLTAVEAHNYIQSQVLDFANIFNLDEIASKSGEMGSLMSMALGLEEDMLKGDFTNYMNLARALGENGVSIIDDFLESGNISGIVGEIQGNIEGYIKTLRESINAQKINLDGLKGKELEDAIRINAELDAQLRSVELMESAMLSVNHQVAVYEHNLKKATDHLSSANSQIDLTEKLMDSGFAAENPMVGFLAGLSEYNRNEANKLIKQDLDSIIKNIEETEKSMIAKGFMNSDGNFILNPEGKSAQDNYIELLKQKEGVLNQIASEAIREIEINNKKFAEQIKESNEYYKELISNIKELHSERWRDISYENSLIDLEKNIVDARNKLAAAKVDGTRGEILSAQEELRRIQQDRRKEIEEQMMSKLEKSLEEQRKKEEDRLEQAKLDANQGVVTATNDNTAAVKDLTDKLGEVEYTKPTTESKPSGGGSNTPRGGGVGIHRQFESLM